MQYAHEETYRYLIASDLTWRTLDKCRTKNILTSIAQFRACYAVGH